MIARLRGRLLSERPECIVDVGGIGLEVLIPDKDRDSVSSADQEIEFYTYLYVREDRLVLYGFLRELDQVLFKRLIDVTGIGPKLALGLLSQYPAGRVIAAIRGADTAFLKSLPGLGKKTAERLAMELADKLDDLEAERSVADPSSGVRDEVILALTSLGMTKHAAEHALERIDWNPADPASIEQVVRKALKYASSV